MSDLAAGWEARKLLRAGRVGTLASSAQGQPFASLVTPACAPDLSVLLLLSGLSEHTRHLRADPRCSVLVAGDARGVNPQTAARVTVTGLAEPTADPALRARYLALHPYAGVYAEFADFSLWRVRLLSGLYVGGFASAARLRASELTLAPEHVAGIMAVEGEIVARCNADQSATLGRIAGRPGDWRMVSVDIDGCDLAQGEHVIRIHWSLPVVDCEGVRRELDHLAHAAGRG